MTYDVKLKGFPVHDDKAINVDLGTMFRRLWIRWRCSLPKFFICVAIIVGIVFLLSQSTERHAGRLGVVAGDETEVQRVRRVRYERYQEKERAGPRDGPGEGGMAVKLTKEEQEKADSLFKKEAFNIVASDKIAMDRSVKDTRDPA